MLSAMMISLPTTTRAFPTTFMVSWYVTIIGYCIPSKAQNSRSTTLRPLVAGQEVLLYISLVYIAWSAIYTMEHLGGDDDEYSPVIKLLLATAA